MKKHTKFIIAFVICLSVMIFIVKNEAATEICYAKSSEQIVEHSLVTSGISEQNEVESEDISVARAYMKEYFSGLTTNLGENYKYSCGYVALGMLLSYYDNYLSDDIIPEAYDVVSSGEDTNMVARKNSPGIYNDYIVNAKNKTMIEYLQIVESTQGYSLHSKLIMIGRGIETVLFDENNKCRTTLNNRIKILEEYLDWIGIDKNNYSILSRKTQMNDDATTRTFIKNNIDQGYPVLIAANYKFDGDSHAMICYDYKEEDGEIIFYGHRGYASQEKYTYFAINSAYDIFTSAMVLKFNGIEHKCTDNYEVVKDGVAKRYCYCNSNIYTYTSEWTKFDEPEDFDGTLIVPNWVTKIGADVFSNNKKIKNVKFEGDNNLTHIGDRCFYSCSNLRKVTLEYCDNLEEIGTNAFSKTALTAITIPKKVSNIGEAFWNCNSLSLIRLMRAENDKITNIVWNDESILLSDVYPKLTKIYVPEAGYERYKAHAALVEGLSELITVNEDFTYKLLNDGTYSIDNGKQRIKGKLIIPEYYNGKPVTEVAMNAFSGCDEITEVELSKNIKTLGINAFKNCKKIKKVIMYGVVDLDYAFNGCENISMVEICYEDESKFATPLLSWGNEMPHYTTVYSLKGVEKRVEKSYRLGYGEKGLIQAAELEFTYLTNSNAYAVSAKNDEIGKTLVIPSYFEGKPVVAISDDGFANKENIENLIFLPDSQLNYIGNNAFAGCSSLKYFTLPSSLKTIQAEAFKGCNNLVTVYTMSSAVSNENFSGAQSLDCIVLLNGEAEGKEYFADITGLKFEEIMSKYSTPAVPITTGTYRVSYIGTNKGARIVVPSFYKGKPVVEIAENAYEGMTGSKVVSLPYTIKKVGANAFKDCTSLETVYIPSGVTSIGAGAFSGCTSLTSINLSNGLTSISANAFSDCTSLTSIEIPSSVTVIESNAFAWCSELHTVTFTRTAAQGITQVGEDAFKYCEILATVNLPEDDESGEAYYNSFSENNVNLANAMMGIMLI